MIGVKVSCFAENSIRTQIALFWIWRKIDPPLLFLQYLHLRNTFSTYFISSSDSFDTFSQKHSGYRTSFVNFSVCFLMFLLKLVQPQIKHKISIFLTCCLPKELNFNLQYLKKKSIGLGAVGNTIPSDIELFYRKIFEK